jgi:hypothetical protein
MNSKHLELDAKEPLKTLLQILQSSSYFETPNEKNAMESFWNTHRDKRK